MKDLFLIGKVVTVVLLLIFMQIWPAGAVPDPPSQAAPFGCDVPPGTIPPGYCKAP
ncbi:hypothetical protein ES319_A10G223300v1 [Gossypium barbadense]|uniref:Uncharacterized protein n=1 Tax=Gossypium barbadense TaxID=3634 RepID=A0A5J5UAL6_GOSBA|nr:hypothetical protein ES319_A10G223300v1 [Gossypium barbadense]